MTESHFELSQAEKVYDHFFRRSSFATYALTKERNVVKVSREVPLERLGPVGCGLQTGAWAVMNVLNVRQATGFSSFFTGEVGCSAIMAARAVGALKCSFEHICSAIQPMGLGIVLRNRRAVFL